MEALGINLGYLLSQIVNFAILLFLMQRLLYRPILNMLSQRRERIKESLEEAERVKQAAAAAEDEHQKKVAEARREAREAVDRASEAAKQVREQVLAEARNEAKQIVSQARREAEEERRQAVTRARDDVADLAILAARRVIGDTLDEPRQRKLVSEFLDKLEKEA